MASNTILLDGDYTRATEIGLRRYTYPFRMNGDIVAAYFEQDYWQTLATFSPVPFGTPHDVLKDFLLVIETKPVLMPGNVLSFTRTWSRVPATQTVPKSIMVNRPSIPANVTYDLWQDAALVRTAGGGQYAATQFFDFSSQVSYGVYGPITVVTAAAVTSSTGGTFTLTYKTSTTSAIAYNASAATVQTAINGLAAIIADGITVTVSNAGTTSFQVNLTAGSFAQLPTVDFSSLTPAKAAVGDFYHIAGIIYLFVNRIAVSAPAHGIVSAASSLIVRNTPSAVVLDVVSQGNWSIFDAGTLLVSAQNTTNALDRVAVFMRNYVPTSSPVLVNAVTRFSMLPITPDTYQGAGDAFFQALFSNSPAINYQVGDSARWPTSDSPMNSLTTIQVNAANL